MLVGIILAAGRSSRMGRAKALLPHLDPTTTFVTHAVRAIRAAGVEAVLVVGRAGDAVLQAEVARTNAEFVISERADEGQLASLVAGLDAAEHRYGAAGVLVMPVDVPLVSPAALAAVIRSAASSSASIARAVHQGRHGHPVIFRRDVFQELRDADPAVGARAVVRADPGRVLDVEVGEPGVTIDVDTPADYERAFGRSL